MNIRCLNTRDLRHEFLHVRIIKVNSFIFLWVQLSREDLEEDLKELNLKISCAGWHWSTTPTTCCQTRICRGMWKKDVATGGSNEPRRKRHSHSKHYGIIYKEAVPSDARSPHVHIRESISRDELASHPLRACLPWPHRIKTQMTPKE